MRIKSGNEGRNERSKILIPFRDGDSTAASRTVQWLIVPALALSCLVSGFAFALLGNPFVLIFAGVLGALGLVAIWGLPDMSRAPTRSLATPSG